MIGNFANSRLTLGVYFVPVPRPRKPVHEKCGSHDYRARAMPLGHKTGTEVIPTARWWKTEAYTRWPSRRTVMIRRRSKVEWRQIFHAGLPPRLCAGREGTVGRRI